MKKYKFHLQMPYKLALSEATHSDKVLLSAVHLSLALNWVFSLLHIFPIIGFLFALGFWVVVKKRESPFSNSAISFARRRLLFHFFAILTVVSVYFFSQNNEGHSFQAQLLLSYVLIPLALYDTYHTSKGGLGLSLIRPLTSNKNKGPLKKA